MNLFRQAVPRITTNQFRRFNFRKIGITKDKSDGFDQYSAHSPLFMGRWGIEEKRAKIFFEHPPVPNRIAKFVFLFMFVASFSAGVRQRMKKYYKSFTRDVERSLLFSILPFVQAMEDDRFIALDQRNFMIIKSVADSIHPQYFDNIRWRYHQEDVYVPDLKANVRRLWNGKVSYNQSAFLSKSKSVNSTFHDKGLFDARETGYTY